MGLMICLDSASFPVSERWPLLNTIGLDKMEATIYILVTVLALGVIFFAIAFREPPKIPRK
jgi:photosystem II PsbT protein